jgi:hypothetical protein
MKVVFGILSDIHFAVGATHPILGRADAIASAISSVESRPDCLVLLLSGDIAATGDAAEYEIAKSFISSLKAHLKRRFPLVEIKVVSVPGNHDLVHEENSEGFRKNTVEGSRESLLNPEKNLFYLKQLLDPQRNYWEFDSALSFPATNTQEMICRSVNISIGSHTVRLNLLNTALLSQRKESQGALLLPMPLLHEALSAAATPNLTLAVMHHAIYWIESQTLTDLRDLLAKTSDYLITGHEHFSSGYEVKDELGDSIRYYESPALFDPKKPKSSAFRVLAFDLAATRDKVVLFSWKSNLYSAKSESQFDWQSQALSRIDQKLLTMNSETIRALSAPGLASPTRLDRTVSLQDIFEYPDLKLQKAIGSPQVQLKRSGLVLPFLTEGGNKEVHGAPLSGKTTVSKAIVLDIRLKGLGTPVWLDGKSIECKDVEDFQKIVRNTFKQQYSPDQLDSYLQLHSDQRFVVIDDWHQAAISAKTRSAIYEWLASFSRASILMVDQTYRIRELIAGGRASKALGDDPATGNVVHSEIANLSNVSQANLIHKYLRFSNGSIDYPEESNEAAKMESLVSQMLNGDRLPSYPFFILCILQAIEGKKTNAIAGGSHGPLYEVLILNAMSKENPEDPQISKKLVFLQEIAYFMWAMGTRVISPSEIDGVMDAFTKSNYLTLPANTFLDSLVRAKILIREAGNYTFSYPQYFYYFVARFIREHIDEDRGEELRQRVDEMIDKISSVENAEVVMFLIYFEKDKNRIIDRLLRNASLIYKEILPARLEEDASDFAKAEVNLPIDGHPDVAKTRREIREMKDTRAEKKLLNPQEEMDRLAPLAYSYDPGLTEQQKLHLVSQSMNALGQVIRNFSANLPGQRKVQVLKETYLLALRALARVMSLCKSAIEKMGELKIPENNEVSILELKRSFEDMMAFLPQIFAVSMCRAVSDSVGIADMDRAYNETADSLGKSVAIRIIDLTVKMHHFEGFPETVIRDLRADVKGNTFSAQVLKILVLTYLLLHPVDEKTLVGTLLTLDVKPRAFRDSIEGNTQAERGLQG